MNVPRCSGADAEWLVLEPISRMPEHELRGELPCLLVSIPSVNAYWLR